MPATSTSKLVALLRPWEAAFNRLLVSSLHADKNGVVEIAIDTSATPTPGLLREAMDLLWLAAIVDGAALRELMKRDWLKDSRKASRRDEHAFLTGVSGVSFTASHRGLDIHKLTATLVGLFTTTSAPNGSPYSSVRGKLVQKVISRGLGHRLEDTVSIACSVNSRHESTFGMWQLDDFYHHNVKLSPSIAVEDFFKQLATLAKSIQSYRQTHTVVNNTRFEVPFIHLKLETCLPITSCIVDAVEAFMQAQDAGRVQCTEVKLDPHLISCSDDDLLRFVQAISRGSPGLSITTGFTPHSTRMSRIDSDDQDRSELILKMMRAIASCTALQTVDLGPLLYLLRAAPNRNCVWRAVLEILLAPSNPSPIGEFLIDSGTVITDEDASYIQSLSGITTRPRRQVECLRLGSRDASDFAILAVLDLVRDMPELDIVVELAEVASATVTTILRQYPRLRSLRICGATIESMAVFSDVELRSQGDISGSCIESLDLFVPTITDRSTFTAFFCELADPTTAIAKTLRCLGFECPSGEPGCELDVASATLLKQVLETNRTLTNIDVMLGVDVPKELQKSLESHKGDIILKKGPIPEQEARKYAFLSVMKAKEGSSAMSSLDGAMIGEIFAFTAPYDLRRVSAMYVEDDGEEEASDDDEDNE